MKKKIIILFIIGVCIISYTLWPVTKDNHKETQLIVNTIKVGDDLKLVERFLKENNYQYIFTEPQSKPYPNKEEDPTVKELNDLVETDGRISVIYRNVSGVLVKNSIRTRIEFDKEWKVESIEVKEWNTGF